MNTSIDSIHRRLSDRDLYAVVIENLFREALDPNRKNAGRQEIYSFFFPEKKYWFEIINSFHESVSSIASGESRINTPTCKVGDLCFFPYLHEQSVRPVYPSQCRMHDVPFDPSRPFENDIYIGSFSERIDVPLPAQPNGRGQIGSSRLGPDFLVPSPNSYCGSWCLVDIQLIQKLEYRVTYPLKDLNASTDLLDKKNGYLLFVFPTYRTHEEFQNFQYALKTYFFRLQKNYRTQVVRSYPSCSNIPTPFQISIQNLYLFKAHFEFWWSRCQRIFNSRMAKML